MRGISVPRAYFNWPTALPVNPLALLLRSAVSRVSASESEVAVTDFAYVKLTRAASKAIFLLFFNDRCGKDARSRFIRSCKKIRKHLARRMSYSRQLCLKRVTFYEDFLRGDNFRTRRILSFIH